MVVHAEERLQLGCPSLDRFHPRTTMNREGEGLEGPFIQAFSFCDG